MLYTQFTSLHFILTLTFFTSTLAKQDPINNIPICSRPKSIAIIGAGAAGSSTAYHLTQFSPYPLNITIFESSTYIGGRTTTINALNDPRYPTELGGSIFVRINQILYNASQTFNLATTSRSHRQPSNHDEPLYDLGIFDGTSLLLTIPNRPSTPAGTLGSYWDIAKLFWKYGLSPLRLRNLQQSTINKFLNLYDSHFPFPDLTSAAQHLDLLRVTNTSGSKFLRDAGVSDAFAREIVQASTRVNYAQNLDIHGLEAMVCMSTDGAMAIEGGNWRIFDEMVRRSGANVVFNTTITAINSDEMTLTAGDEIFEGYDTVVLAAPFKDLKLIPEPRYLPQVPEYVSLHVTLFTSPFRPDPTYFGLGQGQERDLPESILTTVPAELDGLLGRQEGIGPVKFWSLSTLRILEPGSDDVPGYLERGTIPEQNLEMDRQYLYKIFSPRKLDAVDLMEIFGWEGDVEGGIEEIPEKLVSWSHEKRWDSYPYLPPTDEFDCFNMYGCRGGDGGGKVWYTSGIEKFISTMETSALSGMNVARLIVDGFE